MALKLNTDIGALYRQQFLMLQKEKYKVQTEEKRQLLLEYA
jgi:hypothetical protein